MSRRILSCLVWVSLLVLLLGAGLWLLRRPLLALVGVSLPEGPSGRTALTLPAGFDAGIFAGGLQGPRFMAVAPDGTVFVAERDAGRVIALPDRDADGRADKHVVVDEGFDRPSSLAFRDGMLYVAETGQVLRLQLGPDLRATGSTPVVTDLPPGGQHFTRTILFGLDGRLYVSIGSSCNVCRESDPHRAAVWVYPPEGGAGAPFVTGLRNAVGLAVNPWRGTIWATNNGRDLLGDDQPPETVYELEEGADAGWPHCHAAVLPDPEFGEGPASCEGVLAPVLTLQAHTAPLGLEFYPDSPTGAAAFPPDYRGDLYIALHGSWNRSVPVGYKVVRVPLADSGYPAGPPEDFATGFRRDDGQVLGRPAGLIVLPDGSMLVSDDRGGFIYRVYGN